MKLAVINGSPRGKKSNTSIIVDWMLAQHADRSDFSYETFFTANVSVQQQSVEKMKNFDTFLVVFPLYTDAMPGMVKELFEHMEARKQHFNGKDVYFIVHSGFPESKQSVPVIAYLEQFAQLMNMNLISYAIKGSSEGFRVMPEMITKKYQQAFELLGNCIAARQLFNERAVSVLSKPEKLTTFTRMMLKVFPMGKTYWNMQLKRNGAYKNRKAQPLA